MSITPLITIAEADITLALSPEWLVLGDPQKDAYIYNASLYMQTSWSCVDIDWADPTTLDDDIKKACALYAEADRLQVLFDDMVKEETHGKLTMTKQELDGLKDTKQWSMFGAAVNGNPLDSVDAIMSLYCTSLKNSEQVIRV